MTIVFPDILAEGRDFSIAFCAVGFAVGFLLWLTGWRGHRFWIVLIATVSAGVAGLIKAKQFGAQPLTGALLLAIAAGLLALALVRLIAFAAGGTAGILAMRLFPNVPWQEPLIWFLAGGLLGLLLFRLWTMVLTGCAGAVLMAYFGLWLGDQIEQVDSVLLVTQQPVLVNSVCLAVGLLGAMLQFLMDRRAQRASNTTEPPRASQRGRRVEERRWFGRTPFRRAG
jgi:hypothetical protein